MTTLPLPQPAACLNDESRRATLAGARRISLAHLCGVTLGLGTQAVFAVTVVYLFTFLRYGPAQTSPHWIAVDAALALQFAVPHSVLLHPVTRKWLSRWIRAEFYGAVYCLCTCGSLLLLFQFWRGSERTVWDLQATAAQLLLAAFAGSWAMLFYSLQLTGLGYQTGWTQWLYWYRGQRLPRREFVPRGLYQWLRHPVYLSFLGLIWCTPQMTADHALLTGLWTIYIAVGSVLKDRRLAFYLGEPYRCYMRDVPGYPLLPSGPLGRLRDSDLSQHASRAAEPQCSGSRSADMAPRSVPDAAQRRAA